MTFLPTYPDRRVKGEDPTLDAAAPAAEPPPPADGTSAIDRYVTLEKIGAGGMGIVYKAYDPELGRTVALKVLAIHGPSKDLGRRLLREAQALARLSHPNVVTVHDVGITDGNVFVAMEFIEGATLRAWLRESDRDQRAILDACLAAGEGLAAAHRAGLVHRDFKPDNVMVGTDGRVRVLDFGLARVASNDSAASASDAELRAALAVDVNPGAPPHADPTPTATPSVDHLSNHLTALGSVIGTPRYMAPEQHRGEPTDERADQFSFCVVLYQALYGSLPFAGKSTADFRENVLKGKVCDPPPGARVPGWIRQVLLRGLAVEPSKRHDSMTDLLAALRRDPRVHLQRWIQGAAAVLVIAVGLFTWRAERKQQQRACRQAAEARGRFWNGEVKAKVRESFLASGAPFAADTYGRLDSLLDRYANAWTAMRTEACEATELRHEQSAQLMDLRMECLDRRANELSALLNVFGGAADRTIVEHAVEAANGLGDVKTCADRSTLTAAVPPPADAKARERIARLRARLDDAQALARAGQFGAGVERASGAREEARAIGYPPLEAEASLLVGALQKRTTDGSTAEATLRDAVRAAAKAHDDVATVKAWAELVDLVGHAMSRPAEGIALSAGAEAAVLRAGDTPALRATLLMSTCEVLQQAGRSAEALADAEMAVSLWERAAGADSLEMAQALTAEARVLGAFERWEDSIRIAERALAIYEKRLGPEHPEVGRLLVVLGNELMQTPKLTEARQSFERALAIEERSLGGPSLETGTIHNGLGVVLDQQGHFAEAVEAYQQAVEVGEKLRGPVSSEVGAALLNMAWSLHTLRRFPESRKACERGCDILVEKHAVGPDHPIVPTCYDCLGMAALDERRYSDAIGYFQRAVAIREKTSPGTVGLAQLHLDLARAYLAAGHARDALPLLARVRAAFDEHDVDATNRGDAHFTLARALWETGDHKQALLAAGQACDEFAQAGLRSKADLARATEWLAARNH